MFVDREGMKEWRNGGVNHIQCRLVEEAERLEAKLMAGTMHQAGRPRLTGGGGRGAGWGGGPSRTLALDPRRGV